MSFLKDPERVSVGGTEHHFQDHEENKTNHDLNSERVDLEKVGNPLNINNFSSFINNNEVF